MTLISAIRPHQLVLRALLWCLITLALGYGAPAY